MSLTLSDADRAAIKEAARGSALRRDGTTSEAIYLAGLRAGIERAAVVCENHTCGSPYPMHLEGQVYACAACAAAIRELLK